MMSDDWALPLVLETPRLRLAPCDGPQAQVLAGIMADSRVHQPFYVGTPDAGKLQAQTNSWAQQAEAREKYQVLCITASLREGGAIVGAVKLTGARLAYFVAPQYWRQGLGLEMVAACCEHLPQRLGLAVLETLVIRENTGSRRILELCGFDFMGLTQTPWNGGAASIAMLHYRRYCN